MKFIIIGLGNFGASLAIKLTEMGHEVIGVDKRQEKIEGVKDRLTFTIALDSTNLGAIKNLPIEESDVVIVAIGEDEGASILTTALIKQHNPKRLISRAITVLHHSVLEASGSNCTKLLTPSRFLKNTPSTKSTCRKTSLAKPWWKPNSASASR
jgi:trk system potassium uptake protein